MKIKDTQLQFNTYSAKRITELFNIDSPLELFKQKYDFNCSLKLFQIGVESVDYKPYEGEISKLIDELGGYNVIDWEVLFKELRDSLIPEELMKLLEETETKNVPKKKRTGAK